MAENPPQITDHQLLRCIGRGSYGEVWLARSVIGTFRAIKVVYRQSFANDQPYERELRGIKNFEPISRTHEGFVDILQVGRNDEAGYYYYIMELADDRLSAQEINPLDYEAKTLGDEVQRRGKLPFKECLELSLSLTSALGHLHQRELIHRDIKPSNIIFVNGIPKIADIGLVADASTPGSFVGTPGFIPPEGPGTPQADIYSLGKVLYEISTGKDRLEFPELPDSLGTTTTSRELIELNEIVLKACENDHRKRYRTAEEMHADLVLLQAGKSVQRLRLLERRFSQLARASLFFGLATAVIAGMFFLERARRSEVRQRLVGRFVSSGLSAMQEGDLIGSLPLFTEALRLDLENGNSKSEETHRMRITSVLERCPRLVRMWLLSNVVWRAEFTAGGDQVLLSVKGDCRRWNVADGAGASKTNEFGGRASYAAFSRDGRFVAASGGGTNIWIAPVAEPQTTEVFHHTNLLLSVALSPDGRRVVAAASNAVALIWERGGSALPLRLEGHTNEVWHAEFSHDGRRVVTASIDGTAMLWDSTTGQHQATMRHSNWVYYATFSPDGQWIATSSFDRTARIWSAETGEPRFFAMTHNDGIRSVEFSPDGKLLVTAGLDFVVRIWDFRTGKEAFPPLAHSGKVTHASFSPNGKLLVTCCWDGTVRVWDLNSLRKFPSPTRAVFSPDGNRFAEARENHWLVKGAVDGKVISDISRTVPAEAQIHFDNRGEHLIVVTPARAEGAAGKRAAQLWNASTGQATGLEFEVAAGLTNLVMAPGGEKIAAFAGQKLAVQDSRNGSLLLTVPCTNSAIRLAQFSPDGHSIAVGGDSAVEVWSIPSRTILFKPIVLPAPLTHVEFAPDGNSLVTSCTDDDYNPLAAQVWDARTGEPVGRSLPHADGVMYAAFSPDSRRIATGSEDFTAAIWDARRGRQLTPALKHQEQVHHVAFNQDGRWVITATSISGQPGTARIWDAATGEPVTPPILHPDRRLKSARFVAGDKKFVTITTSNETRIWELPRRDWAVEDLIRLAQLLSAQPFPSLSSATPQLQQTIFDNWQLLRTKHPEEFLINRED